MYIHACGFCDVFSQSTEQPCTACVVKLGRKPVINVEGVTLWSRSVFGTASRMPNGTSAFVFISHMYKCADLIITIRKHEWATSHAFTWYGGMVV